MAPDVWPDHDERKNAGTFSMRHDVDPENVLSLSARFRSRFFRRFILGRFPGHVFWTFWITFSGRFIFALLRIMTVAKN